MGDVDPKTKALIAQLAKEAAEDLPPMEEMMRHWIDSRGFITPEEQAALNRARSGE